MKKTLWLMVLFLVPILGVSSDAIDSLGRIPVQNEGRIKPLDTMARTYLLSIHGKSKLKGVSATEWMWEVMLRPQEAHKRQVFQVRNPEIVKMLELEQRKKRVYSFDEIYRGLHGVGEFVQKAFAKQAEERTLIEKQIIELQSNLFRYMNLGDSLTLSIPQFKIDDSDLAQQFGVQAGELASYTRLMEKVDVFRGYFMGMRDKDPETFSAQEKEIHRLSEEFDQLGRFVDQPIFNIVPPLTEAQEAWTNPWNLLRHGRDAKSQGFLRDLGMLVELYRDESPRLEADVQRFIETHYADVPGYNSKLIKWELWYNQKGLFVKSVTFYILGLLLLAASWMVFSRPLRTSAFVSILIGLGLHALGLTLRSFIMARPPVSTLYESIVFVGFVAVFICALVEWGRRDGMGSFVAATVGTVLHFIGFGYASDGDTMGMLVAVLNSNFWLATHVVTIAIGYGAAFVAGVVGHLYLVMQIAKPNQTQKLERIYQNMIGLALVALFFTLFGTILGGIWADQSWGRFWGWDPKENGALLIVLWFLMIMHGRLSGMFDAIGFAVGLVINNIIVALAWFGVNLLNVGLHSYGFAGGIATNLAIFCGFELLFSLVTYFWATRRMVPEFGQGTDMPSRKLPERKKGD